MKRIHLSRYEYLNKHVTYLPDKGADYPLKPNGLWYAMDDEWQAWCDEYDVEVFTEYKYRYELEVDLSKMCVLDDLEPVKTFHWKYGYKHKGNFTAIDWKKAMGDYSGIEVRNYDDLNFACLFQAIIWLQNWTVSGGCIWDLSAAEWKTRYRI